jgi:hypothetical protein
MSPKKTRRKPATKKSKATRAKAKKKSPLKKAAPRKTTIRLAPKAPANLNPKEVETLLTQLQSEERSEKTWLEMTTPKSGEEEDRWGEVEENLVTGSQQGEKRWKHFAK